MGYDDVRDAIEDAMAEGIEVTGEDFEGRPCAYCGGLIDYAELMQNPDKEIPTYHIRVHDPDEPEPEPYVDQYYFCSEECRDEARSSMEWHTSPDDRDAVDRIHEDRLEGNR